MNKPTEVYIIEKVAEAIYNSQFDDEYKDLPINGIERAMARQQAQAAINVIKGKE